MIFGNHNRMHATSRAAWKLRPRFFEVVYEPFHAGATSVRLAGRRSPFLSLVKAPPISGSGSVKAQFRPALTDLLSEFGIAGGALEAIRPAQLAREAQGLLQQTRQRGVQVLKGRPVPLQDLILHRPHKLRKRKLRALREQAGAPPADQAGCTP